MPFTNFHTKDLRNDTFLVTGGAGFIGSHVAEYLLQAGAKKVKVLDNMSNGFAANLSILQQYSGFEFIEGDIRNLQTCIHAAEGVDYISHQAAVGSVPRSIQEPVYFNEVNVSGFVNMLQAAVQQKVKTFVYASSSSVYGDDPAMPKTEARTGNCLSPYAVTKKTNEWYAQVFAHAYGLHVIGFRYFNVFGPRQDPDGPYAAVIPLFVKAILQSSPVYINGDGEQTRDFTFVENAVQANILGMLNENNAAFNQVYNVAAGTSFSVNQLYQHCLQYLQRDGKPIYRAPRAGDIRHSLADISLAQRLLQYAPTVGFESGLHQTIDFFKQPYTL